MLLFRGMMGDLGNDAQPAEQKGAKPLFCGLGKMGDLGLPLERVLARIEATRELGFLVISRFRAKPSLRESGRAQVGTTQPRTAKIGFVVDHRISQIGTGQIGTAKIRTSQIRPTK